jgi:hypothetical protein
MKTITTALVQGRKYSKTLVQESKRRTSMEVLKSKASAHVTSMWEHLRVSKGQSHVDAIVAIRVAKRQPYFVLHAWN